MDSSIHEKILEIQNRALEKLAIGEPLNKILDTLTLGAEQILDNCYSSILLLDKSGTRLVDGSTPSFPQAVRDAFNGLAIGPLSGSCGSASFSKQLVIVEDISTDPRWAKFKDFAHSHGLKSSYSAPIICPNKGLLGTFALTFTVAKPPTDIELKVMKYSTHIACLAIEHIRNDESLQSHAQKLEEFTSIASHDLQEPLRKIIIFGDRLRSSISESDRTGIENLNRMQDSASRMKTLISDILNLTKMESIPPSLEFIDLKKVVGAVLDDLEARISETQGIVNILKLPSIEADPIQMHQLFLNLLGNALKFHRQGVPPIINVDTSCEKDGKCIISIEDNGIGIDEEYLDKIFKPFQRLNERWKYEGTGIGLSICSKIVSNHRGEILAKKNASNGTTFEIILPEKQNF